jgi:putative SOS response-associated peptidase YedK
MCGRFTLRTPAHEVADAFRVPATLFELPPRHNIAPTQQIAAVRANQKTESRELVMFRWGLVPSWANDLAIGNRMINARGETLDEKPSFRKAFAARRCLIVADGFYEWQKQGKSKQPYHITLSDGRPFAMAGLWEHNQRCGEPFESCTIVTTSANALLESLHDRMPVIIPPEHYNLWLDPAVQETERLKPLLTPYDASAMKFVPVDNSIFSVTSRSGSRRQTSQSQPKHDPGKAVEDQLDTHE